MVEAVASISSTSATWPTSISTSLSIASEPDNAWVAARQSRITADQQQLARRKDEDEEDDEAPRRDDEDALDAHHRHVADAHRHEAYAEIAREEVMLSGESERIGTVNFDEDTPFGQRVAIL